MPSQRPIRIYGTGIRDNIKEYRQPDQRRHDRFFVVAVPDSSKAVSTALSSETNIAGSFKSTGPREYWSIRVVSVSESHRSTARGKVAGLLIARSHLRLRCPEEDDYLFFG